MGEKVTSREIYNFGSFLAKVYMIEADLENQDFITWAHFWSTYAELRTPLKWEFVTWAHFRPKYS